jgi:hypothetical protein
MIIIIIASSQPKPHDLISFVYARSIFGRGTNIPPLSGIQLRLLRPEDSREWAQ